MSISSNDAVFITLPCGIMHHKSFPMSGNLNPEEDELNPQNTIMG
jgi:hypothetical protein